MTGPDSSGGHFHFSQDINIALDEIDQALRSFSGKVAPAVNQLNESLAIGITTNPGQVEEFVSSLRTAFESASTSARQTGLQIREGLAAGLANPFSELEIQARAAVEQIAGIFQRGLTSGLLHPSEFGVLQQSLGQVSGTFKTEGSAAATSAGVQAPDFSILDARVTELSRQMDFAANSMIKIEEVNAAVAQAGQNLRDALENQTRVQAAEAERDAQTGEQDRSSKRQAREARTAAEARYLEANQQLNAAEVAQREVVERVTAEMAARGIQLQQAIPVAEPPLRSSGVMTPEQLIAESRAGLNNDAFRNAGPQGPLTVPLGGGFYGRYDDQGANPAFYQSVGPRTAGKGEAQYTEPAQAVPIHREEDPERFAALNDRLEAARAKLIATTVKINTVEEGLALAEELRTRALNDGSVLRGPGNSNKYLDLTTGQGFALNDTARAGYRSEAVPLGDTATLRLQQDIATRGAGEAKAADDLLAEAVSARARAEEGAALGARLAQERESGSALHLGGQNYQFGSGEFVKREGESARILEKGTNEYADAQQGLKEKQARLAAVIDRRINAEESTAAGILQGFKGGFTSRGFESNGDPRQSFGEDITNLSATAGVLAKYSLAGEAVKLAAEALSNLREGTIKYGEEVEHLNIFLEHLNEGLSNTEKASVDLNNAQQVGLSVAIDINSGLAIGTNALAAYQEEVRNGANASDIFADSIKQAGVAAIITGQQAEVASKQLIAITESYGTGSQGQAVANDAIFRAHETFGGDPAQIAQAVAASAPLASQGGIDENTLAAMAGLINARSTQSGTQIASTIERLVSRSQNKQFLDALASHGIQDTGNVTEELSKLSEAYNKLDKPGQQALQTQLGSSRALTGLIPLLRNFKEVTDEAGSGLDGIGGAQEAANKHLQTFGGQMQSLGTLLKTLAVDVGESGIFTPIGVALEIIQPPLQLVTDLLGGFEKAIGPLGREIGGLVVDLLLAAKAYDILAASGGAKAVASGIAAKVGLGATAAAPAVETATSTTATTSLGAETAASDAAATAARVHAVALTHVAEIQAAAASAAEAVATATAAGTAATEADIAAKTAYADALAVSRTEAEAMAVAQEAASLATELATKAEESQVAMLLAVREAAVATTASIEALTVAEGAQGAAALAAGGETAAGGAAARGGRFGFLRRPFGIGAGGGAAEGAAAGVSTLAVAGFVAAGLAVAALGEKAYQLSGALGDADKAMAQITRGSVDELKASAERLATARADINKQSSGIVGSTVNAFEGDPAKSKKKEIDAQIAEIKIQIEERTAAVPLGGAPAVLPGNAQDLATTLQRLTDSGVGTDSVMKTLITTLDGLTGAAQRAAAAATPGSLVVQEGGATGLEGNLLDSLKTLPKTTYTEKGAIDFPSLKAELEKAGLTHDSTATQIAPTAAQFQAGDSLGSLATGITGLTPSAAQSKAFRDAILQTLHSRGKTGQPGEILSPQDLDAIAKAGAESLGLKGKLAVLEPVFEKRIRDFLQSETLKPLTADNVRKDPTLLAATVKNIVSTADQRTSQASARGAGTGELLSIQQKNLSDLQHAYDSIKGAGLSTAALAPLTQGLAVARKNLFDAFQARVQDIAKAAEAGLGGSKGDQAKKAAIEAQVARILTAANKTDPTYLSGSFSSLSGAENVLTNATVKSAAAVQDAASLALRQAERDAAALNAEAAALEASAKANLAFAEAHGGDDTGLGDTALHHAATSQAQADANRKKAKAGVDAAKAPAPQVGLNDPSAQPGIDAGGAAAKSAAAGTDTAAQIAAAKYAASIFPGDQVGEASAAVRTARANLAAQVRGTVAYYDALKSLHQAEQSYANAILQSQANSALLGLDRTNPVLVAREKLREAQAKLNADRRAGAPGSVLTQDKLAVGDAQSQAEAAAFNQRFSDAQTNDQLGRTSHAAYLQYLNNEHNRLTAIRHRTRQQQEELNQIDAALKAASDQMAGQFNIGDIKIPTIYEVRRSIATHKMASAGDTGYQDNRQVSITINGGDINKVRDELQGALGPAANSRVTVAPRKS